MEHFFAGLPGLVVNALQQNNVFPRRNKNNEFALLSGSSSVFRCSFLAEKGYNLYRVYWKRVVDSSDGKATNIIDSTSHKVEMNVSRPGTFVCGLIRLFSCGRSQNRLTTTIRIHPINISKSMKVNDPHLYRDRS